MIIAAVIALAPIQKGPLWLTTALSATAAARDARGRYIGCHRLTARGSPTNEAACMIKIPPRSLTQTRPDHRHVDATTAPARLRYPKPGPVVSASPNPRRDPPIALGWSLKN